MQGKVLAHEKTFFAPNSNVGAAISNGSYPTSGNYIFLGQRERVDVLIHLGAVDAGDTPTFEIQQATTDTGALTVIDSTDCKFVGAPANAGEMIAMTLESEKLDGDNDHITVVVTGTAGVTFAEILILTDEAYEPAAQDSAVLPAASILVHAG